MKYDFIDEASDFEDGVEIKLKAQRRLDIPPVPFHTMSWRTFYKGTRKNRRFYWKSEGSCWTLSVPLATNLLERAEEKGFLDAKYDDPYLRCGGGAASFVQSAELGEPERAQMWAEMTLAGREPDWGRDPVFVVGSEYGGTWRKILIVDSTRSFATFRSCTTSPAYSMAVALPGSPWRMDNAMQDASTAIMRRLLSVLRRLRDRA